MKKTLLIFDDQINIKELRQLRSIISSHLIDLFPLTSNWRVIDEVKSGIGSNDSQICLLNSARLINDEVEKIREKVSKWSANLGDYKIWDKSIKEWFLTPKKDVSTWWFSLLSEKNTLKTDVFFRIAQVQAVEELLKSRDYDVCYLSIKERRFRKVVKKICKAHSVQIKLLNSIVTEPHISKELIKKCLSKIGFWGDLVYSLVRLIGFIVRGFKAKKIMGSLKNRKNKKDSVLFVTYFPAVDKEAAKKGVFRNKYAIPLQDKLSGMNRPISWLFMYVSLDGWSYGDALKLGRKFANNGETVFFLQEFLSIWVILNSVFIWIVQLLKYIFLISKLNQEFLAKSLSIKESSILLFPLWRQSFVGLIGIEGIVYFELYKKVFDFFAEASHCIYFAEMQAWEKALNAAKRRHSQKVKTIGFQHTVISRNYFHYFHSYQEMKEGEEGVNVPLPDILACSGDIPYKLMAKQKYPNLRKVEAIRQLYLNKYLSNNNNVKIENKLPVLLVACSYDRNETISLISLLNEAFPGKRNFKIWLKGHPAQPVDEILRVLDINVQKCGYEIKNSPVDVLLKDATIVMAGATAVGVEALAFGCRVILPCFSDKMFMSPLAGFDKFYYTVYNPGELIDIIERLMETKKDKNASSKHFISNYWCLDETLNKWNELLNPQTINVKARG
jgi:surface carbohydrate biosynthesis protein (TIGR04326 family)